jgi:glycosyltransferase family protein
MTWADSLRSLWWRGLAALHFPGAAFSVQGEWETLCTIGERRASIARYGDGELMIMLGYGIYFQEYDPELARRLREILRCPSRQFLIGLPPFETMSITKAVWRKRWQRYRRLFSYLVSGGVEYHSTALSRPASVGNREPAEYYQAFAALWADRAVVLVHNTAATVEHPIFRGARSVRHVACPPEHAFREYAALLDRASAHLSSPDVLFVISAGPTACVLAWDLAQRGAQALDVGHLTSAYDEYSLKQ